MASNPDPSTIQLQPNTETNMNKLPPHRVIVAILLLLLPGRMKAETFFHDTFSSGSTINSSTPAEPTETSASYQNTSAKSWSPTPSLSNGDLKFGIASTSSGVIEVQARFATNAIALTQPGDYIQMKVVFTNTAGLLTTANTYLAFGLYNSGQVDPIAGGLNGTAVNSQTDHAVGGVQEWQGYVGQVSYSGENSRIMTRAAQTGADNRNQDLVTSGSGSQSYGNPGASTVGSTTNTGLILTEGATYTEVLTITLTAPNTLAITNSLYSGAGTTDLITEFGGVAQDGTYLTAGFDGLAIGWRETGRVPTTIDISSIEISGSVTTISTPPEITSQPESIEVPEGEAGAFFVSAQGFNVTYQWKRYGTNLVDGGNISGANSDTLIISPVGPGDLASGANGYYVTVSGAGGFSTNSVTNSLSFRTSADLTWTAAAGNTWDLKTTASWKDAEQNSTVFNFGDTVIFDDTASIRSVILSGTFLSASAMVVDSSLNYSFSGTGSFAGPGILIYKGSGFLSMDNANSHTGGTIISNSAAYLFLQNYDALGTGPLTLAEAGGTVEIVPTGSSSRGIRGDIVVNDDFSFLIDGTGSFASVFFGDLSGTAGKTLTIDPADPSTTNRIRFYGKDTVYDANLVLNGNTTDYAVYNGTVMAPYNSSGTQIYNGVISGNGGLVQRAGGTTILNGANTYSGGTVPTTGIIGFGSDTVGNVTAGPIGTGPLYLAPELPNTTGSGQVFASGGARTIANPIQYPSATNNQTLVIGGTNDLTFTGPYTLNGNDGTGTQKQRTIEVANTALTTIAGVISDNGQGFGLTKTGAGVLALSNTETYSGPTTVSAGTLLINGQLGAGAVTVTNGTISGSGTIAGPVTIQNGGTLAPGNQGVGTLTLNGGLTLQAGSTVSVEVNKTAGTRDVLTVNSAAYNGTLLATNLSGSLSVGDTFTVINAASHSGNFSSVAGSPGAGLAWAFDPATGVLSVVTGVNPNSTNITVTVSGSTLNLSWPADHLGWTLQSNSVSLTAPDSWFDVPGSAAGTNATINIDSSKSNVFYRLKL